MCLRMQISFNGYSMLGVTEFFWGYWSKGTKICNYVHAQTIANNSFMTFKTEAIMGIFWQITCLKTSGGAKTNHSLSRYPCIYLSGSCCVMTDEPFKKWKGTIALHPPKKPEHTVSNINKLTSTFFVRSQHARVVIHLALKKELLQSNHCGVSIAGLMPDMATKGCGSVLLSRVLPARTC